MEVTPYLELVAGLAGALGSILLAYPSLTELRNRRLWDRLRTFQASKTVNAILRNELIDDVLGGYRRHMLCTLGGGGLLLTGFLLLIASAIVKAL